MSFSMYGDPSHSRASIGRAPSQGSQPDRERKDERRVTKNSHRPTEEERDVREREECKDVEQKLSLIHHRTRAPEACTKKPECARAPCRIKQEGEWSLELSPSSFFYCRVHRRLLEEIFPLAEHAIRDEKSKRKTGEKKREKEMQRTEKMEKRSE